jgi:hypothetical protein
MGPSMLPCHAAVPASLSSGSSSFVFPFIPVKLSRSHFICPVPISVSIPHPPRLPTGRSPSHSFLFGRTRERHTHTLQWHDAWSSCGALVTVYYGEQGDA